MRVIGRIEVECCKEFFVQDNDVEDLKKRLGQATGRFLWPWRVSILWMVIVRR